MAVAMIAVMAAAAAAKAIGSIQQGEAQARAANTQADQANTMADVAAQQGYAREDVSRRSSVQKLASQYAATAQAGIDPNSGSALKVAEASATNAEYDALNVRYGGLAQRDQLLQQRNNLRASASNARANGYGGAVTGIISSAANYATNSGFGAGGSTAALGSDAVGRYGGGYGS